MNSKFSKKTLTKSLLIVCFFIWPTPSFAYLDPGSTSLILTFLVSCLAAIVTFFNKIKIKIKNFLLLLKKKINENK